MVVVDIRLSNDLRELVHTFPKVKFLAEDLLNIVNDKTHLVYKRLNINIEPREISPKPMDLVRNKKILVGGDISVRTFKETPISTKEWQERLDITARKLNLSKNYTNSQLKKAIAKSDMCSADKKFLLANIKRD